MNRPPFRRALPSLESLEHRLVPAWFVKMDTIPGEAIVPPQLDGPHAKVGMYAGGPGRLELHWVETGKVTRQDTLITAALAKATPKLFQACLSGQPIPAISLNGHLRTNGSGEYMKFQFEEVFISSIQLAGMDGRGGPLPLESMTLNYSRSVFEHRYYATGNPRSALGNAGPRFGPNRDATIDAVFQGPNPQLWLNPQDNKGPVTKVTRVVKNGDGSTTTTVLDGKGNATKVVKEVKNKDGSTTITESDGKGNVTKVIVIKTDKNGTTTITEYDGKNKLVRITIIKTDKKGNTTTLEFDATKKLVKKTEVTKNKDGSTTTTVTEYTAKGKVVTKTTTKTEKDKNGDTVVTESDGKGVTKKTVTHKNEDGSTTTTEYDGKGTKTKIVKEEFAKDGTKVTTEADGEGNVKKVTEEKTEADGSKTTTEYEGKGKLK